MRFDPAALDRYITGNYGEDQFQPVCPACADSIDYCQGHGEIGDPDGFIILQQHDNDNHTDCHPDGCEDAPDLTEI